MKTKDNKFSDSLNFVARHYDSDAFSAKNTWNTLGITISAWWRRRSVASAFACVVIAASAFVYYILEPSQQEIKSDLHIIESPKIDKTESCKAIEFNDASLVEVVREIERVYSVKIENVPAKEIRLTLRYEGTAENLVELINEMESVDLKIKH